MNLYFLRRRWSPKILTVDNTSSRFRLFILLHSHLTKDRYEPDMGQNDSLAEFLRTF